METKKFAKDDWVKEHRELLESGKTPDVIVVEGHFCGIDGSFVSSDVNAVVKILSQGFDDDMQCGDDCVTDVIIGAVGDTMTFGDALESAKDGCRITRKGWNGKGMYVFFADNVEFHTDADISEFYVPGDDTEVPVSNMLVLRTAQGTLQPGWLATQSDMLADDWYVLPDAEGDTVDD